jgi:formylglycine-generating enzyme required for sulfatase activity/predicted Ser/Thr protein kinase
LFEPVTPRKSFPETVNRMPSPDTILQNRYRIVRQLGRGGVGVVYEALDMRVNAVVALKETQLAKDDKARREFNREAGLLANLQHSSLPKVMDYFIEGEGEYLVMEFIPGYDLLEMLTRRGAPFHVQTVLRWADTILSVLEFLHRREPPILHRDIKPANLKLTKEEELYLIDFGLAKGSAGQMPTMMTSRSMQGYTPVYSPLEQILGQGTEPRSDLYALGATLYHLLTNTVPADSPTRYAQLEEGKPDPLLSIQTLNPQVPSAVAAIVHQAMALRRRDRPESASAMRAALRRVEEENQRRLAEEQRKREAAPTEHWHVPAQARAGEQAAPYPLAVQQNPLAIQQINPARPRRAAYLIIGAAAILAIASIILALALRQRTPADDSVATDANSNASPLPTATARSDKKRAGPTSLPGTIWGQNLTENLNGVPLEMVLVPSGTFVMGSPEGEGPDDERPQHQVSVQEFYLGKYEVTQAQYRAVMGLAPSEFQGDNLPVETVSWEDALKFCDKLSRLTGRAYRLPSEAEWEYACRAGTTTAFAYGNTLSSTQANFDGRSPYGGAPVGVYREETTPVGSFQPNAFGLYDMHGNVWEWCLDMYHKNYVGAPTDGAAWLEGSGPRVLRGSSWLGVGSSLRSATRDKLPSDNRFAAIGFRVALSAQ